MSARSRLRVLLMQAILLLAVALVGFGAMEIVLRAFPRLISTAVIAEMKPDMRARIATRLGLPTEETKVRIVPESRLYPGATFLMSAPGELMHQFNEPADLALGAVETIRVDEKGFCNAPDKADSGRAEILFAGDSFTFCTSVDPADTASARVEEMTGRPTYNLAIGGTGPDIYLDMLMRHAPAFAPRIAVMGIYEGNDLRDLMVRQRYLETGEDPRRRAGTKERTWSYAKQFLDANLRIARRQIRRLAGLNEVVGIDFRYSAPVNGVIVPMNLANKDHDEVVHARELLAGRISLEVFRQPLADFVAWARKAGIRPVVVYIPSMYTVYEGSVRFEDAKVGEAVMAFSRAQREWIAGNARTIGYEHADITPDFRDAARTGVMTHFPGNVHLTPEGHRIVARRIAGMIGEERAP